MYESWGNVISSKKYQTSANERSVKYLRHKE